MKEYKTLIKASIDVNLHNTIELIKSDKGIKDTGSALKSLLMESPTFAKKYDELMKMFREA